MSYPPPKPGERYRHTVTGREYILSQEGTLINLATGVRYEFNPSDPFDGDRDEFACIQPPEAPAPIKLVEGHRYELDNGGVTAPLEYLPNRPGDPLPWYDPYGVSFSDRWYRNNGTSLADTRIVKDLGPVEAPAPIKLVEGHDYQCRNGGTTGPLEYRPESSTDPYPWWSPKMLRWYTTERRVDKYGSEGKYDIVEDLGPAKPPKHEPKLGDVYRHKKHGGLYMVMRSGSDPYGHKLELRTVASDTRGAVPGIWWNKESEDLFSGDKADFEYIGNDCLTPAPLPLPE